MPVFDRASLQCSFVAYRVSAILMHTGRTPQAGHYTARLLPLSGQDTEITQWSTDDGRTARPCSELLSTILSFLCKAMFYSCAGEPAGEPAGEGTEPRGTLSQETLNCRVKKSLLLLEAQVCNSSILYEPTCLHAERY